MAGTNAPGQKTTRTKPLKKVVGESLPVLQNAVGLMESDTYKMRVLCVRSRVLVCFISDVCAPVRCVLVCVK